MKDPALKSGTIYWVLAAAFLVFGCVILSQSRYFFFGYEGIYYIGRSQKLMTDWGSIFQPDFAGRLSKPLFLLIESILYRFFGLNPLAQLVCLITLHLINVFLLFDLARKQGISPLASLLGSLFFLFLGSQWTIVFDLTHIWRMGASLFFLLSLISFRQFLVSGRKADYFFSLVFFIVSLGFGEDSVSLPAVLLLVILWVRSENRSFLKDAFGIAPFAFVGVYYTLLSLHSGSPQRWGLGIGFLFIAKLANFFREFVHLLIIPRAEFVSFIPIPTFIARLILPFLMGFTFLLILRGTNRISDRRSFPKLDRKSISFCLAWTLVTSLFYAARPTEGGIWHGRYFYFPGMGVCLICGTWFHYLWLRLEQMDFVGPFVAKKYFLEAGLGILLLSIWILNMKTNVFFIQRINASEDRVEKREEFPLVFSFVNQLRELNISFPQDTSLVIEGSPFSTQRLKKILYTYYDSVPEQIIEEDGKAVSGSKLVHLRWEGDRLMAIQ